MASKKITPDKNIVLFVGNIPNSIIEDIRDYEKKNKLKLRIALLTDTREKAKLDPVCIDGIDICLSCDTQIHTKIEEVLLPYMKDLLCVSNREEKSIPQLARVIPNVPYLRTPTSESLMWAVDKLQMRRRMQAYDKKISPKFMVVHDAKRSTIRDIEEKIGFPLVIKPAGLAQSMLVSLSFHREELEKELRKTFRKIHKTYKDAGRTGIPTILVEQYMEGEMYSIDSYVTSRGGVHHCPIVHIKTGRSIGFDDFFGYRQMTPTLLTKESIHDAEQMTKSAIKAIGLRSTTVHTELMKSDSGWKVIELGPRVGGFRKMMYELAYGIDHTMNDILIRIPQKPHIPRKVKGYTTVMKFFAKQEGKLTKLTGIKKGQELESFKHININKKIGDRCLYAKNGGKSVFNITLFNKDRSRLLADIRRLEQMINIETEAKNSHPKKPIRRTPTSSKSTARKKSAPKKGPIKKRTSTKRKKK